MKQNYFTQQTHFINELNLVETFPVDNITIFERTESGWKAADTMAVEIEI